MFPKPLFTREEALLLIGWLNRVDNRVVPGETMEKLKSLVGLWTE